jgi:hypothetical protein
MHKTFRYSIHFTYFMSEFHQCPSLNCTILCFKSIFNPFFPHFHTVHINSPFSFISLLLPALVSLYLYQFKRSISFYSCISYISYHLMSEMQLFTVLRNILMSCHVKIYAKTCFYQVTKVPQYVIIDKGIFTPQISSTFPLTAICFVFSHFLFNNLLFILYQ